MVEVDGVANTGPELTDGEAVPAGPTTPVEAPDSELDAVMADKSDVSGAELPDGSIADSELDGVESVESVVRRILTTNYERYWSSDDSRTVDKVVEILGDESLAGDLVNGAAYQVRLVLWRGHNRGGGPSAAVTCHIFYTLGRQAELGRIADDAYLFMHGL